MLKEELAIKDPWIMAKRTYEIAVKYAYGGIKENETPTKEYKEKGYAKCKFQIALAGYRLADWLKEAVAAEPNEQVGNTVWAQ